MKIVCKKAVDINAHEGYEIISITGVIPTIKLPKRYTGNGLIVLDAPRGITVLTKSGGCSHVHAVMLSGCFFEKESFDSLLLLISKAGQRLHDINQERKEKEKTWYGETTYII